MFMSRWPARRRASMGPCGAPSGSGSSGSVPRSNEMRAERQRGCSSEEASYESCGPAKIAPSGGHKPFDTEQNQNVPVVTFPAESLGSMPRIPPHLWGDIRSSRGGAMQLSAMNDAASVIGHFVAEVTDH